MKPVFPLGIFETMIVL